MDKKMVSDYQAKSIVRAYEKNKSKKRYAPTGFRRHRIAKFYAYLEKRLATIRARCESPSCGGYEYYGGRGIKNFLTVVDLGYLWARDHADKMARPSIDRINEDGNYTVENCRFLELSENIRRGSKKRFKNNT